MRQWLWYHLPTKSCGFQPEGGIYSLLGSILPCFFVLGSRLRDEQSFHADSDGIKPSSPGQWHPDVLPVNSRSHHFSHRCQRSTVFPNEPQVNQAGGRGAYGDSPDDIFSGGSWSLHAAGSKVGDQAAKWARYRRGISAAEVWGAKQLKANSQTKWCDISKMLGRDWHPQSRACRVSCKLVNSQSSPLQVSQILSSWVGEGRRSWIPRYWHVEGQFTAWNASSR